MRVREKEHGVRLLRGALLLLVLVACASLAHAGPSADLTRQILETESGPSGEAALLAVIQADPADQEARFGLAMVRFVQALDGFAQREYRYGLSPESPMLMIPFLRLPVPRNPHPDLLTYEGQRSVLTAMLHDLAGVDAALADMSAADVKMVVDLEKVQLDLKGDGLPGVSLMAVVRHLQGHPTQATETHDRFEVAFDRADAFWLRGYANLLSSALEFVLAYDWRETFKTTGGAFFPGLRFSQDDAPGTGPGQMRNPGETEAIADAVALVHEIRWPLAEPDRLPRARDDLRRMIAMSRESWRSILAETDDDREWIPGPQQSHGVFPNMLVTRTQVDAWLATLDDVDALLDGRKLLGHWRFRKGINLRRFFEEPRPFDLVLWLQGSAALPYLEDGPTLDAKRWFELQNQFENRFLVYAFYFN